MFYGWFGTGFMFRVWWIGDCVMSLHFWLKSRPNWFGKEIWRQAKFWVKMMIGRGFSGDMERILCWDFLGLRPGWGNSNLDWSVGLMVWLWSECDQYKFSGKGGNVVSSEMKHMWQALLRLRPNCDRVNGLLWEMRFCEKFWWDSKMVLRLKALWWVVKVWRGLIWWIRDGQMV